MPLATSSSKLSARNPAAPLLERAGVVALVVLLHAGLAWALLQAPGQPATVLSEMSASFAVVQVHQDAVAQPKPAPRAAEPVPAEEAAGAEEAAVKEMLPPVAQNAVPVSPAMPDAGPDYRADYLNNPHPPYPMVARRMGYQGKVVLNVEVLAEGRAGQVLLQTSSGHQVLDNAAMQTVQGWRFTPARRSGQPVTQWFMVPVKFSLEGNEA